MISRLHLAAIKPMDPRGHQPVPPARRTSRTRVLSPGDDQYDVAVAAAADIPGSAIDTTKLRDPGTGDYSSLGFIWPAGYMVTPGGVIPQ